jgi:hypothetical protein
VGSQSTVWRRVLDKGGSSSLQGVVEASRKVSPDVTRVLTLCTTNREGWQKGGRPWSDVYWEYR